MTGYSLVPQPKSTIEDTASSIFAAKVSRTDPIMVTLDAYGETHEWGPVTWLGDVVPVRGDRCLAFRDDHGVMWAAPDGAALAGLAGRVSSLESTSLVIAEAPLHFRDPRVGGLGDGSDESAKFQAWADMIPASGGELLLDPGEYRAASVRLKSGTKLNLGGGLVRMAASAPGIGAGGAYTDHRIVFANYNANDVAGDTGIEVFGGTIDGAVGDGNAASEFYFCVAFWGVSDFSVHHITCRNVRGEAVIVGRKPALAQPTVSDFEIHNIHLENVGVDAGSGAARQGIAIIEGRRWAVRDVSADTCGAFVVDIEPDDSGQIVEDFVIDGVRAYNTDSLVAVGHAVGNTVKRGFVRNLSHRDGTDFSPAYYVYLRRADNIVVDGLWYDHIPSLAPVYQDTGVTNLRVRNTPGEFCLLRTAQTNIANTTSTAVEWTTEREDPDGMHDATNSTTRKKITAIVPGLYVATVNLRWSSTAGTYRQVSLRVNGTDQVWGHKTPAAINIYGASSRAFRLAAGDYVEALVEHDAGSAIDFVADGEYATDISLVKVA